MCVKLRGDMLWCVCVSRDCGCGFYEYSPSFDVYTTLPFGISRTIFRLRLFGHCTCFRNVLCFIILCGRLWRRADALCVVKPLILGVWCHIWVKFISITRVPHFWSSFFVCLGEGGVVPIKRTWDQIIFGCATLKGWVLNLLGRVFKNNLWRSRITSEDLCGGSESLELDLGWH